MSGKSKKIIAVLTVLVLLAAAYGLAAPFIFARVAGTHVRSIFDQQAEALTPAISALVGKQAHDIIDDCFDSEHTPVVTRAVCTSFRAYDYDAAPISASEREKTVSHAKALDKALAGHGWTADRQ